MVVVVKMPGVAQKDRVGGGWAIIISRKAEQRRCCGGWWMVDGGYSYPRDISSEDEDTTGSAGACAVVVDLDGWGMVVVGELVMR